MTYLLDVNVLIALIDPNHVAHQQAHEWFKATGQDDWSTCPLTENGVIRIIGHSSYPNTLGSPAAVSGIVKALRALPGHSFWPDEISLVSCDGVDPQRILTAGQVTDTYLLALAKSRGGSLATLDRRLSTAAVKDGRAALHLIGVDQAD
ncbi:MAG: PIN domain-containing protein [Mesorhizobium sp.]|nr:PIN domain-containing protein [Mesorhizobium sp.]